jgi:hypothetical protein
MTLSIPRLYFLANAVLLLSLFQKIPAIPKYDVNIDTLLQDNPTWGVAFRETQTLWGVRSAIRGGLNLFGLETPVLGPPFTIPFEFPIFQNLSALFCSAFNLDVAFGSRLISLFFFTLTGLIYAVLIRNLFGELHSLVFSIIYCFTPFSFVWSTTALIESFTNFTLSLFFLWFHKYLKSHKTFYLLLSILSLTITSLSKITTSFPLSLVIGAALILNSTNSKKSDNLDKLRRPIPKSFLYVSIIAASVIPGFVWSRFADRQKESSLFTSWLSSSNLQSWNFGNLKQRLDLFSWLAIGGRLYLLIGFVLFLIPILFFHVKSNFHAIPLVAATFFPPLVYFNLYFIHDYYFMAVHPFACITASLCISALINRLFAGRNRKLLYNSSILVLVALLSTWSWTPGHDYKRHLYGPQLGNLDYIDFIKSNTTANDLILTYGCDWNPAYLYLMDRRGLSLPSKFDNLKETLSLVDSEIGLNHFRYIVDCSRSSESNQFTDLIKTNVLLGIYPRVYQTKEYLDKANGHLN